MPEITITQRIHVGKHRVMEAIADIGNATSFYGLLREQKMERLRKLGALLALPDDEEATVQALTEAKFMDGKEHLFYHEPYKARPPQRE